jgi:hypothetical protein
VSKDRVRVLGKLSKLIDDSPGPRPTTSPLLDTPSPPPSSDPSTRRTPTGQRNGRGVMLVPFVLRSIVLPYLRSATGSTSSSASASATVVRAVPTARTRLRLAGSRSASTATAAATSSARAGLGDDGFGRAWPVEVSGVSAPRHPAPTSPASRAQEQVAPLTRSKYGPPERSMDARQEPEQPKKSNSELANTYRN